MGVEIVEDSDQALRATSGGRIIRLSMEQIATIGRNTKGRTLVRMHTDEYVVDLARAEASDAEDAEDAEEPSDDFETPAEGQDAALEEPGVEEPDET